jgi:hypothetical protein
MPVILATQEADQEDCGSKPAQANRPRELILKKTHHKKGLMKWFKVYALTSNPSTAKTKPKKKNLT